MLCFYFVYFLIASVVSQSCTPIVRKEWRELTSQQQDQFFRGLQLLKQAPGKPNRFEEFAVKHSDQSSYSHNTPMFLPWHRQFLKEFESAMQQVLNDTSFAVPYWQWTLDSQAPENSPLLQANAFGTLGDRNGCVRDGRLANWQRSVPSKGCLTRAGAGSIPGAFYSAEQIATIVHQSGAYDDLRSSIEFGPHGVVHIGIGGNIGDMSYMFSPNDPLFFLHHAYIDSIWEEWQSLGNRRNLYSGSIGDKIPGFNGVTINDVMDSAKLCISYSNGMNVDINQPSSTPFATQASTSATSAQQLTTTTTTTTIQITTAASTTPVASSSSPTTSPNSSSAENQTTQLFTSTTSTSAPVQTTAVASTVTYVSSTSTTRAAFSSSTYNSQVLPDPYDRSDLYHLRKPIPLPNPWIVHNGYDEQIVRKNEYILSQINVIVNKEISAGKYTSKNALAYQNYPKKPATSRNELVASLSSAQGLGISVESWVDQNSKSSVGALVPSFIWIFVCTVFIILQ